MKPTHGARPLSHRRRVNTSLAVLAGWLLISLLAWVLHLSENKSLFDLRLGPPHHTTDGRYLHLEPLIANVADIDGHSFIMLTLTLEMESPDQAAEVAQYTARIQDAVVVFVSSQEASAIKRSDGLDRLRHELLQRINTVLPHDGVRNIYFREMALH